MPDRPRVGLALGSGAVRGMAHIGVLQVLVDEGIPIDAIAGSSIGAIVGGLFAAGTDLGWAEKLAENLMWDHVLEVTIPKLGFSRGDRLLQLVRLVTKAKNFTELGVPFVAVAVDIERGEEVVLRDGPLAEAILASASIPGVFVPRRLDERLLVDGGLLTPVPINAARDLGADVVIAVDVGTEDFPGPVKNIMEVVLRSITIMMREINRHKAIGQAEVYIRPDLDGIDAYDLNAAAVAISRGREAALAALPRIREVIDGATPRPDRNGEVGT